MSWRQARRLLGAVFLINGGLTVILPQKYLRTVQTGSATIDDILDYFADNPALARRIGAVEIAAGLWLTLS